MSPGTPALKFGSCGACGARTGIEMEQGIAMVTSYRRTDPSVQDIPHGTLAVAAVLVALGSAFGLAGFAVTVAAVVGACRRWYHRAEMPPSELARLKWEQAKAAVRASGGAWRETELAAYSPRGERATP